MSYLNAIYICIKKQQYIKEKMNLLMIKKACLLNNQPFTVCNKTAAALASLGRDDIFISESTYHYDNGGCC